MKKASRVKLKCILSVLIAALLAVLYVVVRLCEPRFKV